MERFILIFFKVSYNRHCKEWPGPVLVSPYNSVVSEHQHVLHTICKPLNVWIYIYYGVYAYKMHCDMTTFNRCNVLIYLSLNPIEHNTNNGTPLFVYLYHAIWETMNFLQKFIRYSLLTVNIFINYQLL